MYVTHFCLCYVPQLRTIIKTFSLQDLQILTCLIMRISRSKYEIVIIAVVNKSVAVTVFISKKIAIISLMSEILAVAAIICILLFS
jgi:hypothetical protein